MSLVSSPLKLSSIKKHNGNNENLKKKTSNGSGKSGLFMKGKCNLWIRKVHDAFDHTRQVHTGQGLRRVPGKVAHLSCSSAAWIQLGIPAARSIQSISLRVNLLSTDNQYNQIYVYEWYYIWLPTIWDLTGAFLITLSHCVLLSAISRFFSTLYSHSTVDGNMHKFTFSFIESLTVSLHLDGISTSDRWLLTRL